MWSSLPKKERRIKKIRDDWKGEELKRRILMLRNYIISSLLQPHKTFVKTQLNSTASGLSSSVVPYGISSSCKDPSPLQFNESDQQARIGPPIRRLAVPPSPIVHTSVHHSSHLEMTEWIISSVCPSFPPSVRFSFSSRRIQCPAIAAIVMM